MNGSSSEIEDIILASKIQGINMAIHRLDGERAMRYPQSKPVIVTYSNGTTKEYESITKAYRGIGTSRVRLMNMLKSETNPYEYLHPVVSVDYKVKEEEEE